MDKKELVLEFIREHGQVFSFQIISYFTQHHCMNPDRLARYLVAEGKVKRREPTPEEKLKHGLKARTVIYYLKEAEDGAKQQSFL